MKIVSGHQPVYLPWLGLIHKANLADVFVFMDDVQYLTKDWNNRNRIKTPQGNALWLTVPVDLKNSESRLIKDILVAKENVPEHKSWSVNHWKSISMAYSTSNCFNEYKAFFEWLYMGNKWERLVDLNLAIMKQVFIWFEIKAELVIASEQMFEEKKSDLVLEHGLRYHADVVVTGMHGRSYIEEDKFLKQGIKVIFQDYAHPVYKQRFGNYISHLSFIDLLFNYGKESREICLSGNLNRDDLCKHLSN